MTQEKVTDFYPQVKELYQQLEKKMSKEELAGIELYKFMIHKIMQKYIVKNEGKFIKGETHYDIEAARKENAFVSHFFWGKKASKGLADMLCKIEKQIKEGYIPILEPEKHPKGYVRAKEILGDYKCRKNNRRNNKCRCYNCLSNEIENLVEKKEKYEDYSRILLRKYGKPAEVVKVAWYWISDELINQLIEEIINHQLSPEIINKLNPENINQLRKEIFKLLSPEDINQLREEKIKQLREERKFFKGHQPLKKEKINEKSIGKEIAEEEYKRMYGYYPDLGKK